ncbi:hypothetical protein SAMN04515617_11935 [Collimonas sp. OK242]|jgi:hypothetical protein|uniref:hypothetical protein n=1 Tax=Collimonas sp. OK242 TaxID=1798195 RepID=UPI00089491CA|nr:hypothetical protein [Collimonas sp. OK242]SDY68215.1 hypothetical protein SAMN04515617_11935 [Collimonas sp. OK242]
MRDLTPPLILLLGLALSGCATTASDNGRVLIVATSDSQQLEGARCVVKTDSSRWNVVTPGDVLIVEADGDLHVVCDKPGYRTSEVVYRAPPGLNSPSVGIGATGGSGGIGAVGLGLGANLPLSFGGKEKAYPSRVLVEMGRS